MKHAYPKTCTVFQDTIDEEGPLSRKTIDLPIIPTLSPEEARRYHRGLDLINFMYENQPFQYGHLVEIPPATAQYLTHSANVVEQLIVERIRGMGLTAWLADHAPRLGNRVLNYPQVNRQLEKRMLEQDFLLPMAYDGMIVLEHGTPQFKVLEIQTAVTDEPAQRAMLRAAGRDPDHPEAWYGPENPFHVLLRMKDEFAHGEVVTVMDAEPYGRGGQVD